MTTTPSVNKEKFGINYVAIFIDKLAAKGYSVADQAVIGSMFKDLSDSYAQSVVSERMEEARRLILEMKEEGRVGSQWVMDGTRMCERFDKLLASLSNPPVHKE